MNKFLTILCLLVFLFNYEVVYAKPNQNRVAAKTENQPQRCDVVAVNKIYELAAACLNLSSGDLINTVVPATRIEARRKISYSFLHKPSRSYLYLTVTQKSCKIVSSTCLPAENE